MYPRNAASPERIAVGAVVQISDGAVQTSGVSVKVMPQGGAASGGGGTVAYEEGIVHYLPTQAETNYASFMVLAYKTGCIPVSTTVVTSASTVTGYAGLDWSLVRAPTTALALTGTTIATSQVVASVSGAVGSVTGAVGSVTGAVGSVTGAVGSVIGNVGGNVTGSVGSVVGAVGSVTGLTAADVGAIKAKTDSLNFTVAGQIDSNVQYVNDVLVIGTGAPADEWGPV
jgi:hypothetical protein